MIVATFSRLRTSSEFSPKDRRTRSPKNATLSLSKPEDGDGSRRETSALRRVANRIYLFTLPLLPLLNCFTSYSNTLPRWFPTAMYSLPREKSIAVTWCRGVC